MKNNIIKNFNKSANTYDAAAIIQKKVAENLASKISNHAYQNILEIGCGTGIFSSTLLQKFPQSHFFLTDIAPQMVAFSEKKFSSYSHVKAACMDGEELQLTNSYDLITSSMTMQWFTTLKTSLAKIRDHLSPKGHFYFSMVGENSLIEWRDICKKNKVHFATPQFESSKRLKKLFNDFHFQTEKITHTYSTLAEFLLSLKNLGATATYENYKPISAGKLRKIMREVAYPIEISYEIIYGHYVKP